MSSLFDFQFLKSQGVGSWSYTEESKALPFERFQSWLDRGREGKLQYLIGQRGEKRVDIREVYPQFQSALVFLFPYSADIESLNKLKVAKYALSFSGEDYHLFLKRRLEEIAEHLQERIGKFEYQLSLDILPVLERDLAYRSGLGWFGKNSMFINKKLGSYTIIGSLLLSVKIPGASPLEQDTDHCGQCVRCVEACPTSAIDPETRTIIANQCISTYTIETFKEEEPPVGFDTSRGEIFGCDICQEVCPWNHSVEESQVIESEYSNKIYDFFFKKNIPEIIFDLEGMSNREYKRIFKHTALERPGRVGMIKNLKAVQQENER